MLKAIIEGKVIDKSSTTSKKNGNTYYNLWVLQEGQRTSQQIGVPIDVYNKVNIDDNVTLKAKLYANTSTTGNAFISAQSY